MKTILGNAFTRLGFPQVFFLILNSVAWFYLMVFMINYTLPSANPFISSVSWLFYAATAASMLLGAIIAERVDRLYLLLSWVLLGTVFSLCPILFTLHEHGIIMMLAIWGVTFGIGFSACLALIPIFTVDEGRGRAGGAVFFAAYLLTPLLIIAIRQLDVFFSSLMLTVWRGLGLVAVLMFKNLDLERNIESLKALSYFSVVRHKTFLFYFLPWLAFCLINYFEVQVFYQFFGESMMALMVTMEFFIGFIISLVGGWLMDSRGRKWAITIGLVALGLGYALLSFFPLTSIVQAFYTVVDGIAFGIFSVAFIFVVWGDLSSGYRAEKYYAAGCFPVLLAPALSFFAAPWLKTLDASYAFSLASFFLFLAVIPIFFAPELLPERVIKERELRKYVEEVKKVTSRA